MTPIARFLSRNFAESAMAEVLGKDYLQTTMLLGAEAAVQKFVAALSSKNLDQLSAMCTKPLFNRLESELDRLKARGGESIAISIPAVYDILPGAILMTFGPSVNLSNIKLNRRLRTWTFYEAGATYYLLKWLSLGFVIPRQEWLSSKQPTWQMLVKATEQGGVISVDCEIDCEVEYKHSNSSGQTLYEEKRRRTVVLQLTTRHMALVPSKADVLAGNPEVPQGVSPAWKISDVDNLLQSAAVGLQRRMGRVN